MHKQSQRKGHKRNHVNKTWLRTKVQVFKELKNSTINHIELIVYYDYLSSRANNTDKFIIVRRLYVVYPMVWALYIPVKNYKTSEYMYILSCTTDNEEEHVMLS